MPRDCWRQAAEFQGLLAARDPPARRGMPWFVPDSRTFFETAINRPVFDSACVAVTCVDGIDRTQFALAAVAGGCRQTDGVKCWLSGAVSGCRKSLMTNRHESLTFPFWMRPARPTLRAQLVTTDAVQQVVECGADGAQKCLRKASQNLNLRYRLDIARIWP